MDIILSPGTPPLASHNNCQNNRRIFPDDEDDEDDKDRSSKRFRLGTALTEDAAADVDALVDTPPATPECDKKLPPNMNAGDILSPIFACASLGPTTATDAAASSTSPVQVAAAAKSTATEGDNKLSEDEDDEDASDIPPEAMSPIPITVNADGDIEWSTHPAQKGAARNAPLMILIKTVKSAWENAMPDDEKKTSAGSRPASRDFAAYIDSHPNRKPGWNICFALLREHPGRFYVKNDISGLCYEVSKTNPKLVRKVWDSLCNGKFVLGPSEIPPEAMSPIPITVNADGDIEWTCHVQSLKRDRPLLNLMRTVKSAWDDAVPNDERKRKNTRSVLSCEALVAYIDSYPNRKPGWNICFALLREHPGRFYVKNDISGLCYEVSKTNPKLLER
eukprot:scaffold13356_cov79-Skeletonema_marinoi.AAC.3